MGEICRRLDGLPLAIELAAVAHLDALSSPTARPARSPPDPAHRRAPAISPPASRPSATPSTGARRCWALPNARCWRTSPCSRATSRSTPPSRWPAATWTPSGALVANSMLQRDPAAERPRGSACSRRCVSTRLELLGLAPEQAVAGAHRLLPLRSRRAAELRGPEQGGGSASSPRSRTTCGRRSTMLIALRIPSRSSGSSSRSGASGG